MFADSSNHFSIRGNIRHKDCLYYRVVERFQENHSSLCNNCYKSARNIAKRISGRSLNSFNYNNSNCRVKFAALIDSEVLCRLKHVVKEKNIIARKLKHYIIKFKILNDLLNEKKLL